MNFKLFATFGDSLVVTSRNYIYMQPHESMAQPTPVLPKGLSMLQTKCILHCLNVSSDRRQSYFLPHVICENLIAALFVQFVFTLSKRPIKC